ncbi:MAG: hypothetical protein ATN36_08415 [Epulopiscium sp. Nele67-Bin005]|nr:MAG: hypothetical protein ATN36_08415 [Epulopiscium sp. Nele67-Bin005]
MRNVLIGIILGMANVIPGVSAGTMAVIFKIYDQLLDSISLDINKIKKNFKFLVEIGVGVVVGILVFARIITFLYENFSMQTSFVFMGVIVGSIPMIYKKVSHEGKIKPTGIVLFAIPLAFMVYMSLSGEGTENAIIIRELDLMSGLWLGVAGAVAAFSMIIPGISGSFMLLTLGVYTTILTAVSELNIMIIMPVGIGVLVGLIGGSKLVRVLMKNYTQATYLVILGLVVGSIFAIYPGFTIGFEGISSIVCMILATGVSFYFAEK